MFTSTAPSRISFSCFALPLLGLVAACDTLETARIVSLDEIEPALSVRRPEGEPPAPEFVDEDHFMARTVITRMAFEPELGVYVRRVLEGSLGLALDEVHVD